MTADEGAGAMSRGARIFLVLGAFTAGLVFCFGLVLVLSGRTSPPMVPLAATIGGPFELTDQNGRTVSEQNFKGRPFLVFFGFTHCPEICPTTLFELSEILKKLGPDADRMNALFITVDPERDTPAVLKEYLSSFDSHLTGLTGEASAIAAVAKAYRAPYRKVQLDNGNYTMDHIAIVYLMDKQGQFVSPFSLKRTTDDAAVDLRRHL